MMVGELGLGCMMFGGKTSPDDSRKIIDRAIDAGINFLETANVYNAGESEKVVGDALKRDKKRDRMVLATKVHGRMSDDPNGLGNSRRHIIQACEASLDRLSTDWIDLYQLHRPDPHIPIDETLRALDDLIRAGKVRYIGTSNFGAWQTVEALWASKELGLDRFISDQSPYNLADRRAEREQIPMCQTFGLAMIPWSPLAGGGLTGKYSRAERQTPGTRFGDETDPGKLRRFSPGVLDIVDGIQPLADENGCTHSQFALAWVSRQPGVTVPIIGPRTMEQLEDNLGSLEVEVTDEHHRVIDGLIAPGEHVADYFEASFTRNMHRVL